MSPLSVALIVLGLFILALIAVLVAIARSA